MTQKIEKRRFVMYMAGPQGNQDRKHLEVKNVNNNIVQYLLLK